MTPDERDAWWKRNFVALLAKEEDGYPPKQLERRWLLLASRTWPQARWRVTFDLPDQIYHVLDDADVRAKDEKYAIKQRVEARRWLDA